ncbi:MAG TPA: DNA recombination protein RmuC [Acidobacteriaceae bacterium]|nr:DNA recombination protein RmuC [Acidobacteriaceae bacterium]
MDGMMGVGIALAAILGLLVAWWLGGRAGNGALHSAIAGKDAELAGKTSALAAASAEALRLNLEVKELKEEIVRLRQEKDGLTADQARWKQSAEGLTERNFKQEKELVLLREDKSALEIAKTQAEAQLKAAQQSLENERASLVRIKEEMKATFTVLAGEILDQKSKSFSAGSKEDLGTLLDPLKTQIKEFREKVEQAQSDSNTGVTKLETLIGVLATQSKEISNKAENLTTALRGSAKAQGDWGEFILRDLLDKAGLREGEQYSFQQCFSGVAGEDGERTKSARTDVIVFLPGRRCLIIDSKVSLTAYTNCVNAGEDGARNAALKQHLASVRGHVNGLGKSVYHLLPGIETPDFVVMFVPVEPAFLLALQNDGDLWANAYQQGVLLAGPTTLLYIIRIVNVLWQQELQARNVREVMDRGTKLYEKFVGFVNDLEEVGKSLRGASDCYDAARKKLSEGDGNLVRQVEMLKKLGVRTTKSLPRTLLDRSEAGEISLALAAAEELSEG